MERKEIIRYLKNEGLSPSENMDRANLIPNHLIRCELGSVLIAAVGSEEKSDLRVKSLIDAVHWHIQKRGSSGELLFVIGSNEDNMTFNKNILNAISILVKSLTIPIKIKIQKNFKPCKPQIKTLDLCEEYNHKRLPVTLPFYI